MRTFTILNTSVGNTNSVGPFYGGETVTEEQLLHGENSLIDRLIEIGAIKELGVDEPAPVVVARPIAATVGNPQAVPQPAAMIASLTEQLAMRVEESTSLRLQVTDLSGQLTTERDGRNADKVAASTAAETAAKLIGDLTAAKAGADASVTDLTNKLADAQGELVPIGELNDAIATLQDQNKQLTDALAAANAPAVADVAAAPDPKAGK